MNTEEDYASDSDQSDEDFCPDAELSAPGSEEEESEDISADEDNEDGNAAAKRKNVKKTIVKRGKRTKTKKKSKNDKEEEDDDDDEENQQLRRQTRQTDQTNGNGKAVAEKDEIETDEEVDKSRSDALWADFLSDVKQPAAPKKVETKTTSNTSSCTPQEASSPSKTNGNKPKQDHKIEEKSVESKKIVVTEVVDFAGEAVSIQKTVPADSVKENKAIAPRRPGMPPLLGAQKRPASGSGGLRSILNQLGKKKKISVLEKTKLDWNSFKQDEGIEEQLQTHNKGKDGYLERQDFLQRTDLRQFEIEKGLRQTRRTQ